MVKNSLEWLDKGASRRGFLARTGAVLTAAGLALGAQALGAHRAAASDRICTNCSGGLCGCCTATVGKCCSGYSYTGYTWICCYNRSTALYCWDCWRPDRTQCFCRKGSQLAC